MPLDDYEGQNMASNEQQRLTIGGTPLTQGKPSNTKGPTPNGSIWPADGTQNTETGMKTHREVWDTSAPGSAV